MSSSRIAAVLALAASSMAMAQTISPSSPPASQPDAVAVSPATAKVANDKAIQRSDVATVVQTGPTAADRTRQAADKVQSRMPGNGRGSDTTMAATSSSDGPLKPRADRN